MSDLQKLSVEPTYPIFSQYNFSKVLVIGCGGTGSYVIRDLARAISTLPAGARPSLILLDGDTVEEKNLRRQNFVAADITKNKAEVLANRYSSLGITIGYQDKFMEASADLAKHFDGSGNPVLIISCVDNAKTRAMIRESYLMQRDQGVFWIDCGNEEFTGQVVLAVRPGYGTQPSLECGTYPVPDVFDLYPELSELAKKDKLPTELSCAEMAISSPQYGFVNATAAMLAVNWAQDLLSKRKIKTHAVDFSIDNKFTHRSLTKSALIGWSKFFDPIKTFQFANLPKNKLP